MMESENHVVRLKKHFALLFGFLYILAFSSCLQKDYVKQTLEKAGENRTELEKVLQYYSVDKADTLKLRAARWLIANMERNYAYNNNEICQFYEDADSLFRDSLIHDRYADRLDTLLWKINVKNVRAYPDMEVITSDFLIHNIDDAFEAWTMYPWCKDISFDDFCEYILPYRLGTCPLEEWRPLMRKRFGVIVDSLLQCGAADTVVCQKLCSEYYTVIHYPSSFKPQYPPSYLLNVIAAPCSEWSNLGIYAMRTFGIKAACDFTPQWANRSKGHYWTVLLTGGKKIVFMMGDNSLKEHHSWFNIMAKVYRQTAALQRKSLAMEEVGEEIPALFQDPYFIDVSDQYFKPIDVTIKLEREAPASRKLAYIMVFDNQNWQPVHYGRVKNGKVTFTGMNKECMYTAMYYVNGQYYPASDPFYLDKDGKLIYLELDLNQKEMVRLKRKYSDQKVNEWCKRIVGGKFQVANRSDFKDAVDVYTIDSVPEALYHTVDLRLDSKYRFFRYIAPKSSAGDLAELEFYNENGEQIRGEVIGDNTSHFIFGLSDKYKAFDGNVLTCFEAEHYVEEAWIGMDFKTPVQFSKFLYLPHNDDNFIREDEMYELLYWQNGWHSLGKQKGEKAKQTLVYQAPKRALLRLHNITKGTEERIFVYESGKQIWF